MSKTTTTTDADKRTVRAYVLSRYADRGARNVRIAADGSVSVTVDRLVNSDQAGRMFAGYVADLLSESERDAS